MANSTPPEPVSMVPQYWGQLGCGIGIILWFVYKPQLTAADAAAMGNQALIGYLIGTMVVFGCVYALYAGLARNSLIANWINMILAITLAVIILVLGATNGLVMAAIVAWVICAIIGLHGCYRAH